MKYTEFESWLRRTLPKEITNAKKFATLKGNSHFWASYDPSAKKPLFIRKSTLKTIYVPVRVIELTFNRYRTAPKDMQEMTSYYTLSKWPSCPQKHACGYIAQLVRKYTEERLNPNYKQRIHTVKEYKNLMPKQAKVPQYLRQMREMIKNLPPQDLPPWSAHYEQDIFRNFEVMNTLREHFPNRKIKRADLVALFREGRTYLAVIATMIWGGINAIRPRVIRLTPLHRLLSHPPPEVLAAVDYATTNLTDGRMREAFAAFDKGDHKLPGVGPPYFTKIFFFLGQANSMISPTPLILDKWTANAFFALLAQVQPDSLLEHFRGISLGKKGGPGSVVLRSGQKLANTYEAYVKCMNLWAQQLDLSPGKLEMFVFGHHLGVRNPTNPRRELWNIVLQNNHLVQKS